MRFLLLGPLRVAAARDEHAVSGALRRTLLALLLLQHDTPVSADRLIDTLWGEHPPVSPTTSLYNQIMRLRQSLGPEADRIKAASPGYLVRTEAGELDLESFSALCSAARTAAREQQWADAADAYTAGLELWRGDPLADIPALHGHPAIGRLHEERLLALQGRAEAALRLGRHETLVGELRALVETHPLHEEFHSQLMLALYRSGRRAEALDAYGALRRVMVDELGVEPGGSAKELQGQILRSDPAISAPRPSAPFGRAAPTPAGQASVRQLPADARIFSGREAELDELVALATGAEPGDAGAGGGAGPAGARSGTVVISAINGMGGVGKTALAVRAAHRLGARFPDGQLFIDLHGYSADLDPVAPEAALEYLLRSLGVPSAAIPAGLQERTALYRSRLAGTRTLIVLDNAVNAAQAAPLLPGASGCLVLITSRNRLSSLDDAHLLALDVLPPADAVALLRNVAGPGRIPEDAAAAELAELCGRIPLAVRIAASRLRHRNTLTAQSLIAELRAQGARPDRIDDGERSLTAVFDASLKVLTEPAQRLFRLLGLVPGPDFDAYAAAHLAGTDEAGAHALLETLLDHNLLIQHAPGRYRLHDLLRAHALGLAERDPDGPAALGRLLDFYIHAARAADRLIGARRRPKTGGMLHIAEPARRFADRDQALAWLRGERENLLAAAHGEGDRVRRTSLIGAICGYLVYEGPWSLAAELHRVAIAEARERGDRLVQANALVELGHLVARMGDPDEAEACHEAALALYRELESPLGAANALFELGLTHYGRGSLPRATEPTEQALAIYRELGERRSAGIALQRLGCITHMMGRNEAADGLFRQALEIFTEVGDPFGEAGCLLMHSRVRHALCDFAAPGPMLESVLSLFRQAGSRQGEANALQEIGRQQLLVGAYDDATALLDQALTIHREIGFRMGEANVYWEFGRIRFAQQDLDGAVAMHSKALDLFRRIHNFGGEPDALHELGRISLARKEFEAAERFLTRALEINQHTNSVFGVVEVRNTLAELAELRGEPERALAGYAENLDETVRVGHPLEQAHALYGMARCELRLGRDRREAGLGLLRRAAELYRGMRSAAYPACAEFLARAEAEAD